jgi:hypothetical protein
MRAHHTVLLSVVVCLSGCGASTEPSSSEAYRSADTPGLSGPYLGQQAPGVEPQIFAPGLISTGLAERDVAMTPNGEELYYTSVLGADFDFSAILVTRRVDGIWIEPEVASFSGQFKDLEPAISPDGEQFFFVSYRPVAGSAEPAEDEDIWMMRRQGEKWSEPQRLSEPVNTGQPEFFPSVTRDGTLYFTRRSEDRTEAIFRSRWLEGAYGPAERLGPEVNAAPTQFNAYIDPDERYLIVCSWGREDSLGGVDYYIVFRDQGDTWTGPFNLGDRINTATGQEWSPYVSPDGKYFFFMSSRTTLQERAARQPMTSSDMHRAHQEPMNGNSDIWWVDAKILEELRPTGEQGG